MSEILPIPRPRAVVAVKAKPAPLKKSMRADEACRLALLESLRQIAANAPLVAETEDMEALHQLRVGLRRLQVTLKLFARAFDAAPYEALRLRSKGISQVLSPARDLDVLIEETLAPMAFALGLTSVDQLRRKSEPLRIRAWSQAVATVKGPTFTMLLEDVAMLCAPRKAQGGRGVRVLPIAFVAEAAMEDLLKRAKKRGRHFDGLDPENRHRLRIALKHLRYASEVFAGLYKRKKTERYLNRLKQLQDDLGALNDSALALSHCARHGGVSMMHFAAYQRRQEAMVKKRASRAWKEFHKAKPFWT